jgi:hypothetical protein
MWYNHLLPKILAQGAFKNMSKATLALTGAAIDQTTFSFYIVSNYLFFVNFYEVRSLEL